MSVQSSFENEIWKSWNKNDDSILTTSKETFDLKQPELQSDRDRVYDAVLHSGGITLKELSESWGCPPNCISGRFTELNHLGLIIADGKRYLPNYKGKMYPHTIWRATL